MRLPTPLLAATPVFLSACAPLATTPACPAGAEASTVHTVFFGRNSPSGVVSTEAWQAFVDAEITPRFMDGLSYWAARGQWRDINTARIDREDSFVLQLVVPAHKDAHARVQEIATAYKARFRQQAVLHLSHAGCAKF